MQFSRIVEHHKSQLRDSRSDKEKQKLLHSSRHRDQLKKFRKEKDFDEPIWNFNEPQISVKKQFRKQFEKPSLDMQLEYIQANRWNRFREYGNQNLSNYHDLKNINLFNEMFAPSIFLPVSNKEVRILFTSMDRVPYGSKVEGLARLREYGKNVRNEMVENKKKALERLEKIMNNQIDLFENRVLGFVDDRLKLLKSFEETKESRKERSQREVTYTKRTPFSQLIEFCQDVFMVIFSYLETKDLLINISPSFQFFHRFIKSRIPLTLKVNTRWLSRVPFHRLYHDYNLETILFGDNYSYIYGRKGHIERGELPNLFKSHPELKCVELYHLENCRLVVSQKEWIKMKQKHPDKELSSTLRERISVKRVRRTYDLLSGITSLERLRTCVLPRDMTNLVNLRVLIYPIDFEYFEKENSPNDGGFSFHYTKSELVRVTEDLKELTKYFNERERPKMKELVLFNCENSENVMVRKRNYFRFFDEFLPLFTTLHDSVAKSCFNLEKLSVKTFTGFVTFSEVFLRYLATIDYVNLYLVDEIEIEGMKTDDVRDYNFDFGGADYNEFEAEDEFLAFEGWESLDQNKTTPRAKDWEVWDEEKEKENLKKAEDEKKRNLTTSGFDFGSSGGTASGHQGFSFGNSAHSATNSASLRIDTSGLQDSGGSASQSHEVGFSFSSNNDDNEDGTQNSSGAQFSFSSDQDQSFNQEVKGERDGPEGGPEGGSEGGPVKGVEAVDVENHETYEERSERAAKEMREKMEKYEEMMISNLESKMDVFSKSMLRRRETKKKDRTGEFCIIHYQDSKMTLKKKKESVMKQRKKSMKDKVGTSVGDRFIERLMERVSDLTYDLKIEEDGVVANVKPRPRNVQELTEEAADGGGGFSFDFGPSQNREQEEYGDLDLCDPRTLLLKILEDFRMNHGKKLSVDVYRMDGGATSDLYSSEILKLECFGVFEKLLVLNNPSLEVLEFSLQYGKRVTPKIGDDDKEKKEEEEGEEEDDDDDDDVNTKTLSFNNFSFGESVEGHSGFGEGPVEDTNQQIQDFSGISKQEEAHQLSESDTLSFSFGDTSQNEQIQVQQQDFSFSFGGEQPHYSSTGNIGTSSLRTSGFEFGTGGKNEDFGDVDDNEYKKICYFPGMLLGVFKDLKLGGEGGGGLSSALHTLKLNLLFKRRCYVMLKDLEVLMDEVFRFLDKSTTNLGNLEVNIYVNEVMMLKEGAQLPTNWDKSRKQKIKKSDLRLDDSEEEKRRMDEFEEQIKEKFQLFKGGEEKKLCWERVRIRLEMKYCLFSKRRKISLLYRKRN